MNGERIVGEWWAYDQRMMGGRRVDVVVVSICMIGKTISKYPLLYNLQGHYYRIIGKLSNIERVSIGLIMGGSNVRTVKAFAASPDYYHHQLIPLTATTAHCHHYNRQLLPLPSTATTNYHHHQLLPPLPPTAASTNYTTATANCQCRLRQTSPPTPITDKNKLRICMCGSFRRFDTLSMSLTV